jgi:hypothetical protein
MEPNPQEERYLPSPININKTPVEVVSKTENVDLSLKGTYQHIVYTYADGSKKQTRHAHTDTRITVNRDDVQDTYEEPI